MVYATYICLGKKNMHHIRPIVVECSATLPSLQQPCKMLRRDVWIDGEIDGQTDKQTNRKIYTSILRIASNSSICIHMLLIVRIHTLYRIHPYLFASSVEENTHTQNVGLWCRPDKFQTCRGLVFH